MTRMGDAELERWRKLDVGDVVRIIAPHAVMDATFVPVKAQNSRRWHVCVGARHFELVATGSRFFDTRMRVGGAGAVDLAMHLYGSGFKAAVAILRERGL